MYGKRKSGVFFAVRVGFQVSFLEISQHRHVGYMTSSQHSNVQVTITVTCLNFAVTGSRILLHPLSLSRRKKWGSKPIVNHGLPWSTIDSTMVELRCHFTNLWLTMVKAWLRHSLPWSNHGSTIGSTMVELRCHFTNHKIEVPFHKYEVPNHKYFHRN